MQPHSPPQNQSTSKKNNVDIPSTIQKAVTLYHDKNCRTLSAIIPLVQNLSKFVKEHDILSSDDICKIHGAICKKIDRIEKELKTLTENLNIDNFINKTKRCDYINITELLKTLLDGYFISFYSCSYDFQQVFHAQNSTVFTIKNDLEYAMKRIIEQALPEIRSPKIIIKTENRGQDVLQIEIAAQEYSDEETEAITLDNDQNENENLHDTISTIAELGGQIQYYQKKRTKDTVKYTIEMPIITIRKLMLIHSNELKDLLDYSTYQDFDDIAYTYEELETKICRHRYESIYLDRSVAAKYVAKLNAVLENQNFSDESDEPEIRMKNFAKMFKEGLRTQGGEHMIAEGILALLTTETLKVGIKFLGSQLDKLTDRVNKKQLVRLKEKNEQATTPEELHGVKNDVQGLLPTGEQIDSLSAFADWVEDEVELGFENLIELGTLVVKALQQLRKSAKNERRVKITEMQARLSTQLAEYSDKMSMGEADFKVKTEIYERILHALDFLRDHN